MYQVLLLFFTVVFCKDALEYQDEVLKLIECALVHEEGRPFKTLEYMTDTFGARPSGSDSYFASAEWLMGEMEAVGLENVRKEIVENVAHVIRGEETLEMLEPFQAPLKVVGIEPGSTGDVVGELIILSDPLDLEKIDVSNKVVLIHKDEWKDYEEYFDCRMSCANYASEKGAIAFLIGSNSLARTAQEGTQYYWGNEDDAAETRELVPIPAGSINHADADYLIRVYEEGDVVTVHLKLETTFEFVESYNVIGEIEGSEKPEEIVLVGGHLDSWDVGVGATDDGSGIIVTFEALRLIMMEMMDVNIIVRPRRTIRFVAFCNEELGNYYGGGITYADDYWEEKHMFAYECDLGVFDLRGYRFSSNTMENEQISEVRRNVGDNLMLFEDILYLQRSLYSDYCVDEWEEEDQGCFDLEINADVGEDIREIVEELDLPFVSPISDFGSKYYEAFHHTEMDQMEVLDSKEMDIHVASISSLIYVIADMENEFL